MKVKPPFTMSLRESARFLGIEVIPLLKLMAQGKIKFTWKEKNYGTYWRIDFASLQEWKEKNG